MTTLHQVRVIITEHGQIEGGCIVWRYDQRGSSVTPLDLGPFDTWADVQRLVEERVDVQLTLWDTRT